MKISELLLESPSGVERLKKKLTAAKAAGRTLNYDSIDRMMRGIAGDDGEDLQRLHDDFVERCGSVPDNWIKKQKIDEDHRRQLTEDQLLEGFLDSLGQKLAGAARQQVTNVTNLTSALQVIYKIMSNPQYLETVTFDLKRALKRELGSIQNQSLRDIITKKWPPGRTISDFFKALLLYAVTKTGAAAASVASDQAAGAVINQLVNIDTLVNTIISSAGGAITSILKAIGIGDTLFFGILSQINKKIGSTTPQPATPQRLTEFDPDGKDWGGGDHRDPKLYQLAKRWHQANRVKNGHADRLNVEADLERLGYGIEYSPFRDIKKVAVYPYDGKKEVNVWTIDELESTNESSKYLGPTDRVKIDRRGWQTPLRTRGFGGD